MVSKIAGRWSHSPHIEKCKGLSSLYRHMQAQKNLNQNLIDTQFQHCYSSVSFGSTSSCSELDISMCSISDLTPSVSRAQHNNAPPIVGPNVNQSDAPNEGFDEGIFDNI